MNLPVPPALRSQGSRRRQPGFTLPSWQLAARAAVFAAVGTYTGTALTVRAWAGCPLGNDAQDGFTLTVATSSLVWVAMTAVLLLAQVALWACALPLPGLRCAQWLLPLVLVVVLTAVYRAGMQSPVGLPDGSCHQGYPPFPFAPKTGR